VPSSSNPTPPFGEANLSNCEREQIQLAGSIQPHGALLVVREPDQVVVQASANAAAFLGLEGELQGRTLSDLGGDLASRIRPHLGEPLDHIPVAVRSRLGYGHQPFDCLFHRPPEGGLVIELERAGPPFDLTPQIERGLERILPSGSLRALADETAALFKELAGYDRVMVYRFDEHGHGEVFAEERQPELEPYLGNRYPASDIPQMARRLYERNRVRVLGDVAYAAVPLRPRLSPITGRDLDMSLCGLRSMSPIHIQYLKNMGVAATLVCSLVTGGRLWGLIACHHYVPRLLHYEVRVACELLAEAVATRIAALESFLEAQAELSARRLEQRMLQAIARQGDWKSALFDSPAMLLQPVGASGAAVLFEGQVLTAGDVPGTQQLREIGAWLDTRPREPTFATASLGLDEPAFATLTPMASGLLAKPLATAPGEYLLWFRPEQVRTVTWGGDPAKAVIVGDSPQDLSPRRSFAQWHQLVEGTAERWTTADLAAARLIAETVTDVILQFRSVRMLIAQDQLEHVSRQVRLSELPVVVLDPGGRILLTNEAFERLLGTTHPHLQSAQDLPAFFADPALVRRSLRELLSQRRTWRGEVSLVTESGTMKPFLVRADPVLATPDRLLGFVLLFNDLTGRRTADVARRRFQQGIVDRNRLMGAQLDSRANLAYRDLFSSVLANAELAALEITDGSDLTRMPAMLESVRTSVTRAAELLEHLIWYGAQDGEGG
jgi:two-component system, chemotaxis family, sensor kinase Cph1